jgi:hypothetical protein
VENSHFVRLKLDSRELAQVSYILSMHNRLLSNNKILRWEWIQDLIRGVIIDVAGPKWW